MEPLIEFFDPDAPRSERHGNLPHWEQRGAVYFVTFRLADAMPIAAREEWIRRLRLLREIGGGAPRNADNSLLRTEWRRHQELWLDRGCGSCLLREGRARRIVESALAHFDGARYRIHSRVVAANHVHALVQPRDDWRLPSILHSWKSFTAKRLLELDGISSCSNTIWQKESFDHIVRDPASFTRYKEYIEAHAM
jgi:REP element-mobilizing transposase RayT